MDGNTPHPQDDPWTAILTDVLPHVGALDSFLRTNASDLINRVRARMNSRTPPVDLGPDVIRALSDLMLCVAAEMGSSDAWRMLLDEEIPRLKPMLLRKISGSGQAWRVEEILERLPGRLVTPKSRTRISTFDGRSKFTTWAFPIAWRMWLDDTRRRERRVARESHAASSRHRAAASGEGPTDLDSNVGLKAIRAAWVAMPSVVIHAAARRFVDGASIATIASESDVTVRAVSNRLRRFRQGTRRALRLAGVHAAGDLPFGGANLMTELSRRSLADRARDFRAT